MVRVITISREYGSGGGVIARMLGQRLNWRLIDDSLVSKIAERGRATAAEVQSREESVDPWLHRIFKALWRGGFTGTATRAESEACDAESVARLWHAVILEAAEIGDCVVVGRGGQCLLQSRRDTFHVYVYAPLSERIARLSARLPPGTDLAEAAQECDCRRVEYLRHHFGQERTNPHLYHLMLCSSIGPERAAETVLHAAGLIGGAR
jgi:cytidylate kinase